MFFFVFLRQIYLQIERPEDVRIYEPKIATQKPVNIYGNYQHYTHYLREELTLRAITLMRCC